MKENNNTELIQPEVSCPYNAEHKMPNRRFVWHISQGCREKQIVGHEYRTCEFNALHILHQDHIENHVKTCPDRPSSDSIIYDEHLRKKLILTIQNGGKPLEKDVSSSRPRSPDRERGGRDSAKPNRPDEETHEVSPPRNRNFTNNGPPQPTSKKSDKKDDRGEPQMPVPMQMPMGMPGMPMGMPMGMNGPMDMSQMNPMMMMMMSQAMGGGGGAGQMPGMPQGNDLMKMMMLMQSMMGGGMGGNPPGMMPQNIKREGSPTPDRGRGGRDKSRSRDRGRYRRSSRSRSRSSRGNYDRRRHSRSRDRGDRGGPGGPGGRRNSRSRSRSRSPRRDGGRGRDSPPRRGGDRGGSPRRNDNWQDRTFNKGTPRGPGGQPPMDDRYNNGGGNYHGGGGGQGGGNKNWNGNRSGGRDNGNGGGQQGNFGQNRQFPAPPPPQGRDPRTNGGGDGGDEGF